MTERIVAPYGSWKSPITSELIVSEAVGLSYPVFSGGALWWLEMRPGEGGRYVVVRSGADGAASDVTPTGFSVRTRVHEYGGGAFAVDGETVYFSNDADGRLYSLTPGGDPEPLTPEGPMRFADMIVDSARGRLVCISEDHGAGGQYPVNVIAAVSLTGGAPKTIMSGCDFYSSPRLSPDGSQLCWLEWNHPDMPWDRTQLRVANVRDDGTLTEAKTVAGGVGGAGESIFQPEWSPDGVLHFVSDRTGWWNLYRNEDDTGATPLYPMEAEFGEPHWVFGMRTYAFADDGRIVCTYTTGGVWRLGILDGAAGRLEPIETPFTEIDWLTVGGGRAVFVGAGPRHGASVVVLDIATSDWRIAKRSNDVEIDPGYLSQAEAVEFPTEGDLTAHALFYPPKNGDFTAPDGELPPLLVHIHGGPTSTARSGLSLSTQYWTSRGIAVVDVNYGGSTGYGREYRMRLEGNWGVLDVDDCCNAARYLVGAGMVDPDRLAIAGGSAGGYTTLSALCFRDVFKAGASHFGVSDAEALALETHKFEARYLDRLIAPYPEGRDLYIKRSPIHFVEGFSCPVIFFQGLEDKVVPPDQAERMVRALEAGGTPVAYVAFEGEQHGFRQADHIRRALDGEFYFYARVFGFEPADEIEPVEIKNLK